MHDFADTNVGDKYVIERELGRGGMATVWFARDLHHDRPVAIKILHPDLAGAIGVDRFVREVRLTARLQHPNIVPILDSGALRTPDGASLPWYAMPYLDGETLRRRLERESQLPIDEALRIALAAGAALEAAHRHEIVHRDIKPENIFLAGDHVYVVDFGIAKALIETDVERLTSTGLAIGTPAYMSPEQSMAGRVDARSDQYSLATILYEMLAGEPPFSGPSTQAIIARRVSEPARALRAVRSTVPPTIERAVLKALERAPADRFRDLSAFMAALGGDGSKPRGRVVRALASRGMAMGGIAALVLAVGWFVAARARGQARRSIDPASVALYQRGVRAYDRRTPSSLVEAIDALRSAIARDSANAPAWTVLARSYVRADERGFTIPNVPADSLMPHAVAALDRALALDAGSADTWLTQGMVSIRVDPTDWGPASRSIRHAIALDSTNAVSWHLLARSLAETGNMDAAIDAWHRSVKLDPSYTQGLAFVALGFYWRRQFDSAATWADSSAAVDPNFLLARTTVGQIEVERGDFVRAAAAFAAARRLSSGVEAASAIAGTALTAARAGRRAEAEATLRAADSLAMSYKPTSLHTAVYFAQVYASLGQIDHAVEWLRRYDIPLDLHFQLHLRCDPPFTSISRDPRFRSFIASPALQSDSACGHVAGR